MKRLCFLLLPLCLLACSKKVTTPQCPEPLCGAYTQFRALTPSEDSLFCSVAPDSLTPSLVATQVVAGTNYDFLALPTDSISLARQLSYDVVIFEPLPNQGEPSLTSITLHQ